MTGLGPFDLHGSEFLWLYAQLAVIALVASLFIPRYLRPDGRPARPADEDELAILAGGRERLAEAVAVRLLAAGSATVMRGGALQIRDPRGGRTLAERRVAALGSPAGWKDILLATASPAETAEHKLEARGLLMDKATRWQMRLIQSAPLLLLFLFGMTKWIIGTMRDRPVGYLSLCLFVTVIIALARLSVLDPRTRAGNTALADARFEAARLRRAAPTDEAPLAVALFGTAVLAGSYLSDFHRMRSAGGDGGSGSGDSGSSGCGGGGCGGCGS